MCTHILFAKLAVKLNVRFPNYRFLQSKTILSFTYLPEIQAAADWPFPKFLGTLHMGKANNHPSAHFVFRALGLSSWATSSLHDTKVKKLQPLDVRTLQYMHWATLLCYCVGFGLEGVTYGSSFDCMTCAYLSTHPYTLHCTNPFT